MMVMVASVVVPPLSEALMVAGESRRALVGLGRG